MAYCDYGDFNYVTANYHPTRQEAMADFQHLYDKLKFGLYGDGDDPMSDFEDWDDDFQFVIRTFYYCFFENHNKRQLNKIWGMLLELVIKRQQLLNELKG